MTLGDDLARVLPELRAAAESTMVDTAEVYGLPVSTWVEESASYEDVPELVHTGPCEIKVADVLVNPVDAQGQQLIVQRSTVKFPVSADTLFPEDFTIKIIESRFDPANVGRLFRITGPHAQTYATARRYPVEETS